MKFLYWLGVLGFCLLPLNFMITIAGKIWHGDRMVEEDLIGFAVGLFGFIAATVLYKGQLAKRESGRGSGRRSDP